MEDRVEGAVDKWIKKFVGTRHAKRASEQAISTSEDMVVEERVEKVEDFEDYDQSYGCDGRCVGGKC